MPSFSLKASVIVGLLALAGCANLAPSYSTPEFPSAPSFPIVYPEAEGAFSAEQLSWDSFITDEKLKSIIRLALDKNKDIQLALVSIEKAQALLSIDKSNQLPSIDASGGASFQRISEASVNSTSASVGFTAFELDFFSKKKNLTESAWQQYLASEQALRVVQALIVSEVSTAFLQLAAANERLTLSINTLKSHYDSYRLIKKSHELGAIPMLAVAQSKTLVDSARGDVAFYTQQTLKARNALTLLAGDQIKEDLMPSYESLPELSLTQLEIGIPSEVLLLRPDIIVAEHKLKAANANIGVARAALYPSITIGGSASSTSSAIEDLFSSGTGVWSFIPKISLPIFDGGRRQAGVALSEAEQKEAQLQYEKAIHLAFREVADLLADKSTITERLQAQKDLITASEQSVMLSQARFDQGLDSHLNVLDAQRGLYNAKKGLIDLEVTQRQTQLLLYRALGGGAS